MTEPTPQTEPTGQTGDPGQPPWTVVVAVADREPSPALEYAAADLARRGAGQVRVAHVAPEPAMPGVPDPLVVPVEELRREGADVVEAASELMARLAPEATVVPTLLHGAPAPELVRCADGADRTVLLRRPRGLRRAVTLSTSNGVAAQATGPVVVVPADWRAESAREPTVVVALDDVASAPLLLRAAQEEAAVRGGRLRVVHAWEFSHYDAVVLTDAARAAYQRELRGDLERELLPARAAGPQVPVELVVEHAHVGDLVVAASEEAELLVLGRHRPRTSLGTHLGSVARAVLRESVCPVLVVDPAPRPY